MIGRPVAASVVRDGIPIESFCPAPPTLGDLLAMTRFASCNGAVT